MEKNEVCLESIIMLDAIPDIQTIFDNLVLTMSKDNNMPDIITI